MPYNPDGTFSLVYSFGTGTAPNNQFPPQVGTTVSDMATSIAIPSITSQPAFGSYVAGTLATKAGLAQTDFLSGGVSTPTVKNYWLILSSPKALTLNSLSGFLDSGTSATFNLTLVNPPSFTGTIVGNSAMTITGGAATTTNALSAPTTLSVGGFLAVVVTAVTSPGALFFTAGYTETLSQ